MITELISKIENLEREMKRDLLVVKINRTNQIYNKNDLGEVFQEKEEGDRNNEL